MGVVTTLMIASNRTTGALPDVIERHLCIVRY